MQNYFYGLADRLTEKLQGEEVFTASYDGEESDFIRFNQSAVRQAGHVTQHYLGLDLIDGGRHAGGTITLTLDKDEDDSRLAELVADLRGKLTVLPEDPHLLYATDVRSTEQFGVDELSPCEEAVAAILAAGEGRDLVGIHAQGGIFRGFANSFGQRNWYSNFNFNFDWSFYHHADKGVKSGYAGFRWNPADFAQKVDEATEQLSALGQEAVSLEPGKYRVYLAPIALADYVGILAWAGFGLKARKTKQTTLIKMAEDGVTLSPQLTIRENTKDGVCPNFQEKGFLKPDSVTLIEKGKLGDPLVSPRSAREFDVPTNGASGHEYPDSIDIEPGTIPKTDVLERLGTGLYINNLWYLNLSDRPAARITGMTRFATFWVEDGDIKAPLNVMRFDESALRALGENLIGLTRERETILDPSTYGERATSSVRLPGALVEDFNFNL